mgnify:FL=1|jgi:hypothetical protein
MLTNWLLIYMGIGIVCGLCFDILFDRLDMEPPTNFERLFWFVAWPFFLVIFLWGIYSDDEE